MISRMMPPPGHLATMHELAIGRAAPLHTTIWRGRPAASTTPRNLSVGYYSPTNSDGNSADIRSK